MSRVTIQDVAKRAGVSRATVSRVLNDNPGVDATLRERVLEAIKDLGYKPNRAARRLRKPSHDVIGLIISDIQNPYFSSVMAGIEDMAYARDMNILVCNTNEDPERFNKYLDVMRAESVSGLIVVPTSTSDGQALHILRRDDIPVIILDRTLPDFEADAVRSDNVNGAYQAVQHLLEIGYRRIAIIYPGVPGGYERFEGYKKALTEARIAVDDALVRTGAYESRGGYTAMQDILAQARLPEAVFTATNLITLGAMRAIREQELRVPQDIALMSFDDLPFAEELCPPLSAVAQQTFDIGQEAMRMLLQRLEKPDLPYRTSLLQTRLIIRESCGYHYQQKQRGETE